MATFIREIPPDILFRLYSMLDVTGHRNNWRMLAGHAGFRMVEIQSFQRAQYSGGSPTEELLRVWGYQNIRVSELFEKLARMKHAQAMKLIMHLVDPKLHYMIDNIQGKPLANNTAGHRQQPSNYMAPNRPGHPSPSVNPDNGMPMAPGYPQPSINYNGHDDHRLGNQPNISYHGHDDHRLGNQHSAEPANYYHSSQQNQYMPAYPPGSNQPSPGPHLMSPSGPSQLSPGPHHMSPSGPSQLSPGPHHMSPSGPSQLSPGPHLMSPSGPSQAFHHPDSRLYDTSSPYMHRPQETPPPSAEISRERREQMVNAAAVTTTIHMDYEVIKKATNNFDERYKLGEGSFGKVYLADINQTKYAVKVLLQNDKLQVAIHDNHRSDQSKELKALARFKHKNIVLMCFFSVDGDNPCIIYEYIENGSLEDNLLGKRDRPPLSWEQRHQIAEGSALGINHLHKASKTSPLIHGDIKSANILLDKYFEPKIADFGLARPGPTDGRSFTFLRTQFAHGTLPYLPEEFQRNLQLSVKVDAFSFGVVLMEMLTGQRAYSESRKPHQLLSIYVSDAIDNNTMPLQELKDEKCADWPDKYFEGILMLAKSLVGKFRQRPEMDAVLKSLKAIFYGEDAKDKSSGAGPVDHADSPTHPEGPGPRTKQETKAANLPPPPEKHHMLEKLKKVSLTEDDSKLTEVEIERQKSIDDFHRKLEMMSLEAQNKEPHYGKEQPSSFPGPDHSRQVENDPTWENSGKHISDTYQQEPYRRPEVHHPQTGPEGKHLTDTYQQEPYRRPEVHHPQTGPEGKHLADTYQQEPYRRPEVYHPQTGPEGDRFKQNHSYEAEKMPAGVSEASFSGRYQDISSTSDSSNNPSSYTHRYLGGKETVVDRAYYEGYQLGFQRGFQEAVLQLAQLRGMQQGMQAAGTMYRPDQMVPGRDVGHHPSTQVGQAGPLSSVPHSMANVPASHVTPGFGYGTHPESRRLASMDGPQGNRPNFPHTGNRTDDAKITTSGELSETNSHEKSVAALQTKPISLSELRYHKEPQQSTEPM